MRGKSGTGFKNGWEWEKANTAISQSLKLLESLEQTTEQQRILAQTLDIQGQFLQKTGQSQAA